jgi:hypothetical protein
MAYMTQSERLALLAARGEQQRLTDAAQADDRMEIARMRYPPARPTNGMSADGLSYSVANDFDKQLAQASAEYDARTRSPRFVPGARVEQPDAPDLLREELFAPVMAARDAYTGTTPKPPKLLQPKTFELGGQLVTVEPDGQAKVIHSAPAKAAVDYDQRQFANLDRRLAAGRIETAEKNLADALPRQKAEAKAAYDKAVADYEALKNQNVLQAPTDLLTPAPAPMAAPPTAYGFIGSPGEENKTSLPMATGMGVSATRPTPAFDWNAPTRSLISPPKDAAGNNVAQAAVKPTVPSDASPSITTKAEFDKLPSGATYLNKGKLHRKP